MSVYYSVKEYLEVQEITEDNSEILYLASEHLAWLGWSILNDNAYVNNVSLSFGDKKLTFSGDTMNTGFHEIIRALNDVSSFELSIDYNYFWSSSDFECACDHLAISSYLENTDKKESQHIFYTMHNWADCADDGIGFCAYGEKNNHVYNGIVQDEVVSDFPDTGNWYAPGTTLIYDPENLDGLDVKAIASVIEELNSLNEDDNIIVSENRISYYMDDFQPKNAEDFKKFAYLAGRLIDLTKGSCYVCAELVDLDNPHGRILKINFENNGKYTITMAAVK